MINRALVTGGAGFIGSHLVRKLIANGTEVHILVDVNHDISRLDYVIRKIKLHKVTNWKELELRGILHAINPEAIFHLRAAINNDPSAKENSIYKINFEDTKQLVEATSRLPSLASFIYTGTIAEYGGAPAPFREDGQALPISDYGRSKLATTKWLQESYRSKNFPVTILRLSVVYGPWQKLHLLIPRVIMSCLKKQDFYINSFGAQTRDPLFAEDAVDGFLLAASSKNAYGKILNFGLGKEHAILDIANMINNLLDQPIKILTKGEPNCVGESDHYWHDIEKAKNILGWIPKISLEEGLKRTVAWYEANQDIFKVL